MQDSAGNESVVVVRVQVVDTADPPMLASGPSAVSVAEEAAGVEVGTFAVFDQDAGSTLTWNISDVSPWSGWGLFELNSTDTTDGTWGVKTIRVAGVLDYEDAREYNVTLTVSDGSLNLTHVVRVEVVDVNDPPVFVSWSANAVVFENEGGVSFGDALVVVDEDVGDVLTWSVVSVSPVNGSALIRLNDSSTSVGGPAGTGRQLEVAVAEGLDYEAWPEYNVTVSVQDSAGNESVVVVRVSVVNIDEPPDVDVAATRFVGELSLVGQCIAPDLIAIDPDFPSSNVSYFLASSTPDSGTWAVLNVSSSPWTGCLQLQAPLDQETTSSFLLQISYCDKEGLAGSVCTQQSLTIVVGDEPEPPTDFLPSIPVDVFENATAGHLIAPVSAYDPEGADLTFLLAEPAVNLSLASIGGADGELRVATSLDFEQVSQYTLNVSVTDNQTLTSYFALVVNVLDVDEAPDPNPRPLFIDENSPIGSLIFEMTAFDPESDTLTWSLPPGATPDQSSVSIAPSSGTLTSAVVFNFEARSQYWLQINATDSALNTGGRLFSLSVIDVQEPPEAIDASVSLVENSAAGTLVHSLIFTDPEDGIANKVISIIQGDSDGLFQISNTGALELSRSGPNFEEDPVFNLTILVEDATGLNTTARVNVTVVDVNEAPLISAGQLFSVNEKADMGFVFPAPVVGWDVDNDTGLVWTLTGGNVNNVFAIDSAGYLSVADNSTLDFETRPSYSLTVELSDGSLSDTKVVTVQVLDQNDIPVLSPVNFTIAENTAGGTLISTGGQPSLLPLVNYTSDEDSAPGFAQPFSFEVLAGDSRFEVSADGNVFVAASGGGPGNLDFETGSPMVLQVRARDAGGEASVVVPITFVLGDVNEHPSVLDQTVHILENATMAGPAAPALVFADEDAGDSHTCALVLPRSDVDPLDPGSFLFDVVGPPCTIRRAAQFGLNHEAQAGPYSVTLQVEDALGLRNSSVITVHVDDVPEPPRFIDRFGRWDPRFPDAAFSDWAAVNEVAPPGTAVYSLNAFDEDVGQNSSILYSFGSIVPPVGASYFDLDNTTGLVRTTLAGHFGLSFEDRIIYNLTVFASDGASPVPLVSSAIIHVSIEDSPEAPVVVNSTRYAYEHAPAGWQLSANSTPSSALLAGDAMDFIDSDFGATGVFQIVDGDPSGWLSTDGAFEEFLVAAAGELLDFETATSLTLTVQVEDNSGLIGYGTVQVLLVDIDDPAIITSLPSASVDENAPPQTSVYNATFSDVDGDFCMWSILAGAGPSGNPFFSIDEVTGQMSTTRPLNFELDPQQFNVTIQCNSSNSGGKPTPWGPALSSLVVVVDVADKNDPPVVTPFSATLAENSAAGTFVGLVPATDEDLATGQELTWSVSGGDPGSLSFFSINVTTGELRVSSNATQLPNDAWSLDFENQQDHWLFVSVQDNGADPAALVTTVRVNISLADENEPPLVDLSALFMSENAPVGSVFGYNSSGWQWWGREASALSSPFYTQDLLGLTTPQAIAEAAAHAGNVPNGSSVGIFDADLGGSQAVSISAFLLRGTGMDYVPDSVYTTNSGWAVRRTTSLTEASAALAQGQCCGFGPLSRGYFPASTNTSLPNGKHKQSPIPPCQLHFDAVSRRFSLQNGTLDHESTPRLQILLKLEDDGSGFASPEVAYYLLDLHVLDANEPSTLQAFELGTTSMNENAALGSVVGDTFLQVVDQDDQVLLTSVLDNAGSNYFNATPAISFRDDNGTRLQAVLEVVQPALPSGTRLLTLQAVDLDDFRLSSKEATMVVRVADVNDLPQLPAATTMPMQVFENSPEGTIVATIEASDADLYQMLTYSVQGDMAPYFRMVPDPEVFLQRYPANVTGTSRLPTPETVLDRYSASPYFGNITRRAHLVVARNSIDYESMLGNPTFGKFEVTVRVQDEHYVSGPNGFQEPTPSSPLPRSSEVTYTIVVRDVPDVPEIFNVSIVSPFGLTTAGGEEVTLTGYNLGSEFDPHPSIQRRLEAVYFSNATQASFPAVGCRVTKHDTEIKCSSSAGFGAGYSFQLALEGFTPLPGRLNQLSNWSNGTITYASPNLVEFSGAGSQEASSNGSQLVRIRGSQFGTVAAGALDSVTYGPTGREYNATDCAVVVDHSTIECLTAPGVGKDLRWVVVIAGLTSQTPTTSYAAPSISSVRIQRGDSSNSTGSRTSGGLDFLLLEGDNFGALTEREPAVDLVQYGLLSAGDSQLSGRRLSSGWSDPQVPSDQDCSLPTPAVTGDSRLNPSLDVIFTATACRVVASHTLIRCTMAAGMGSNLHVQVTVRGQRSPVSPAPISYARPSISGIVSIGTGQPFASTDGSTEVVVSGQDFGRPNAKVVVFFGVVQLHRNGSVLTDPYKRGIVIPTGSHTARNFVAPPGHGRHVPISIQVQCQESEPVETFSYRPPSVALLDHLSGGLANPPIRLAIDGTGFGECCFRQRILLQRLAAGGPLPTPAEEPLTQCQCNRSSVERVTVFQSGTNQPFDCDIESLTETRITCALSFSVLPGPDNTTIVNTVLDGLLQVHIGEQASQLAVYQYGDILDRPSIEDVTPETAPTTGGTLLSLTGFNFGNLRETINMVYWRPNSTQTQVVVQPVPQSSITFWSDTMVNFTVPAGQGNPAIEMAFSGTSTRVRIDRFSYAQPVVERVLNPSSFSDGFLHAHADNNPNVHPTSGVPVEAPLLVIQGRNFGQNLPLPTAAVVARGIVPSSDGATLLEGGLRAQPAPTGNGVPATLLGSRLENFVTVGSRQCPIVSWSSAEIRCRAPPGVGIDHVIAVHVYTRRFQTVQQDMWRRTEAPTRFSYHPPAISALVYVDADRGYPAGPESHGPTTGGALVELHGSSFGSSAQAGSNLELSVEGAAALGSEDIEVHTHSIVRFRTPPGQGSGLALSVRVAGQSVSAAVFNYDPPVVFEVSELTSVSRVPGQAVNPNASSTSTGQLRFNARGSTLVLRGLNFGAEQPLPSVQVGGFDCLYNSHTQSRVECQVSDVTVGPKSLRLEAARQVISIPESNSGLFGECRSGEFGIIPGVDRCYTCPGCFEAACARLDPVQDPVSTCTGGTEPPVAAPGFWRLKRSELGENNPLAQQADLTDYEAQRREEFYADLQASLNGTSADGTSQTEFIFTRCMPPEGCVGNNTCADGYEAPACSICTPGSHQRDLITGGCTPCPDAPMLYMVAMLVGVIVVGAVLFKLYKKGPSVAALGIAVDYFQILSVFSTLSLEWPETIVFVFKIASASAASVEVTSPECAVEVSYNQKWYFFMGIPLVSIIVLGITHCLIVFKKWLKFRGKVVDNVNYTKHLPAMIGFLFMMLSFLYISLCSKAFEVLRCIEVGGLKVLQVDTEVSCTNVEYERMSWWARVAIGGYGAGIPLVFGIIIFKSAQKMKVDQALRIRNLAGSRDTNPYYDMQKRFKRLYFKFKPEYYYWLLVILARKFLIVLVSSLLFDKPMLAATSTVIVLFAAVLMQLIFMPYRQHTQQTKDEATASGALGDEIPKHILEKLRKELAGGAEAEGKPSPSKGNASQQPAGSTPKGIAVASLSPPSRRGSATSVLNPLSGGAPSPSSAARKRKPNSKAVVDVYKRGVELDGLLHDRSLLMANDPSLVLRQPTPGARASAGSTRSGLTKSTRVFTKVTNPVHSATSRSASVGKAKAGGSAGERQGRSAKGSNGCWGYLCCCCGKDAQPVEGLELREEARKGGKTKVKVKYLYDYNSLETTFLACGIFVLLSGVMFKSADATDEVKAGSAEAKILEYVVIVIVVGSTFICVATVLAELVLGFKYFMWAGEVRRQREREAKRQAILEGRKVQLSREQKALLVWSKFVYACPSRVRRGCACICNVPAPGIITGAAYKATIVKVAKGKTKETAAIHSRRKASSPGRKRALTLGRSVRGLSLGRRGTIDARGDETDSESDGERQKREEAEKLAANAQGILDSAKPQGKRVRGLGVVENATPRRFAHLKDQKTTSIHDSNVRREAILARLRAATKSKGRLPAGVVAPTAAASSMAGGQGTKAQKLMAAGTSSRAMAEESTDSVKAHMAAQRAAAQEAALANKFGVPVSTVSKAVNSATAAGILRTDGDDFLMSAAAKQKRVAVARYVLSVHLGRITNLQAEGIQEGQLLRMTLKTGHESEKTTFMYRPQREQRTREVRLLIFDPAEDTVHCTLYADFKDGGGSLGQHELVLGHLHFRTDELPEPSEDVRVERIFNLRQYDGKVSGRISLLMRLQHRGAAVDDWVELGLGVTEDRVPTAPSQPRKGFLRSPAGAGRPTLEQGDVSLTASSPIATKQARGSVFGNQNPIVSALASRKAMPRKAVVRQDAPAGDSKSGPSRRGSSSSDSDGRRLSGSAAAAAAAGIRLGATPRASGLPELPEPSVHVSGGTGGTSSGDRTSDSDSSGESKTRDVQPGRAPPLAQVLSRPSLVAATSSRRIGEFEISNPFAPSRSRASVGKEGE